MGTKREDANPYPGQQAEKPSLITLYSSSSALIIRGPKEKVLKAEEIAFAVVPWKGDRGDARQSHRGGFFVIVPIAAHENDILNELHRRLSSAGLL